VAFASQEDVMSILEKLVHNAIKEVKRTVKQNWKILVYS
jgi:aspartyl/asparaginyl-tRNA synthetase